MWRFKPSKYKNAVPKVPKKGEGWITDISIGSIMSFGNHVQASAMFIAFNVDSGGGGNLGILPINASGSQSKNLPLLHAHSDLVTDFDFCPYDDGILATGSQDHHVKLWRISEENIKNNIPNNPEIDILLDHRLEVLKFHPQADCILSTADDKFVHLWDINTKQNINSNTYADVIQNISWRYSGDMLASTCKDKKLRIWDPRDPGKCQVTASHNNNRESRVIWLGDSEQLVTTGFGSGREREVLLRDIRKIDDPVASYFGESSLGVYIPLFDPDTNMLFLLAKADTAVSFWEVLDRAPYLQEATKYLGDVQTKGAALVPKRALEIMDGEVNRVLLLGQDCIVPISFQVPRKSYREFHSDLFPDTYAPEPSLTSLQWQAGEEAKITKISLGPSKNKNLLIKLNHHLGSGPRKEIQKVVIKDNFSESKETEERKSVIGQVEISNESAKPIPNKKPSVPVKPKPLNSDKEIKDTSPSPKLTSKSFHSAQTAFFEGKHSTDDLSKANVSPSPRRAGRAFGMRVSKFRHLNGNIFNKEYHITDLTSLTRTIPGECNGFDANEKLVALPIGAAGNFIAVLELSKAGRAPSAAEMPGVLCKASVMDFVWDPFDSQRLATACDTGEVQIWNITEEYLSKKSEDPMIFFRAHSEKVTIIKFHPCAKDIISTASSDLTIRIWDLPNVELKYCLTGHTDIILNFAWSPDGQYIASACKDQNIRIYDPRNSTDAIKMGSGPQGTRGARVTWVLNGTHLVISGFSKVSERQLYLYDIKDLSTPIGNIGLDVSPATLIPYYDEDSSTLFLTGKGDSIIFAYEVAIDTPYFHPLSHYKCPNPHQALSFLPKFMCNVKDVEFARAVRLTSSTIEPMTFFVPRLRSEYFQDDLFPDTHVTWEPSMTNNEWFSGQNKPSKIISMRPSTMPLLSEAPPPTKTPTTKPSNTPVEIVFEGEVALESSLAFLQNSKEKEERIVQSMLSQCHLQEDNLPQEAFEGVDPKEWDEEEEHTQQNL